MDGCFVRYSTDFQDCIIVSDSMCAYVCFGHCFIVRTHHCCAAKKFQDIVAISIIIIIQVGITFSSLLATTAVLYAA